MLIICNRTDSSFKLVRTTNNDNDAVGTDSSDDDDDSNDYDEIKDDNGDYDDTDLENRSNVLLNQNKIHKASNAANYHNSGSSIVTYIIYCHLNFIIIDVIQEYNIFEKYIFQLMVIKFRRKNMKPCLLKPEQKII